MTRVKLGVIGVGALGRHHARILNGLSNVELVAVAEPNAAVGQAVAEQLGVRWIADYREILDEIDAASIVVPTTAHLRVAADFLRAGKHVLVEKPLASNVLEGSQIVELARQQGVVLQVGHIERFNPAAEAVRAKLREPKYIRSERLSPFSFRSTDIGVIHDVMIHDLDLVLDFVQSPVHSVEALGVAILGGHEDSVQARIVFENGCVADLVASRVHPTFSRRMQLWSPECAMTIDFTSREVTSFSPTDLLAQSQPLHHLAAKPGADVNQLKQEVFGKYLDVQQTKASDADALTAELSDFVDCIQTGRKPRVDGSAGLAALELAERVRDSVACHQWDGHAGGRLGANMLPAAVPLQRTLNEPERRAA